MWWIKNFVVKGHRGASEKEERSPRCRGKHICKQIETMERLCFSEELTQLHGGDSTSNCTEDLEERDLSSLKEYIHSIA